MRKLRRILPIVAAMVLLLGVVSAVHAEATVPGTDNNYATGDTITVTLTFSEAVTVTGTPYVVLDIGGQPRHAAYSGDGSSMAAQPFSYTVLPGDKDTDGVSLQANSLTLNGGAHPDHQRLHRRHAHPLRHDVCQPQRGQRHHAGEQH